MSEAIEERFQNLREFVTQARIADAVACGRLYVYGLAAAGATGMIRLFEILEDEIRICLSLLGVCDYGELDKSYVRPARRVVPPHVHSAFPHLNLPRETY
jgi:glycolate oxidase